MKESEFDVQAEAQELSEILDAMEEIKVMPNPPAEQFYSVNRASRRSAEKRDRALKKRDHKKKD